MQPTPRILCAVVTRNRETSLARVLGKLTSQTLAPAEILVVDNDSKPSTQEMVDEWKNKSALISYHNTGLNSGSAGGQRAALAYGVERGFDLVYTMDDDCEPQTDALERIVAAWRCFPDPNAWALNSLVLDTVESNRMSFGLWDGGIPGVKLPSVCYRFLKEIPANRCRGGVYEGWGCLFNGTLLPTSLVRRVGYPREELFIRGDEAEYFFRLLRHARVGTVLGSVVRHPSEEAVTPNMPIWKRYYSERNRLLVRREYFPSWKTSRPIILARAARFGLHALLWRDAPVNRALAFAFWDAAIGNFHRNAFGL